jgi:hypothetical protein
MSLTRDEFTEIAVVCMLAAGSVAALLVAYGRWSDFGIRSVFLADFHRWHWIRLAMMLTLVTSLAARAGVPQSPKVGILSNPLTYAVVVVPFVVFMMMPPAASFLAAEEGELLVLFGLLGLIHGVGFCFLRALFRKGLDRVAA